MLNRKEKEAVTKGRYVEMDQSMLKLITTSQHISRGKYRTFFKSAGITAFFTTIFLLFPMAQDDFLYMF